MPLPAALLGLLENCKKQPDEDSPRLILADWLEDHEEPSRAELVRLQCQPRQEPEGEFPVWNEREQELLAEHAQAWLGPMFRPGWHGQFSRGLVSVGVTAEQFLADAGAMAACDELAWIEAVQLHGKGPSPREVFACPLLAGVSRLDLRDLKVGVRILRALGKSPVLTHLADLNLCSCNLTVPTVRALAESAWLKRLTRLNLSVNRLGAAGLKALADSPHPERLNDLDLASTRLAPEDVATLIAAPWFRQLRRLDLSGNMILNRGVQTLASANPVPPLVTLDLGSTGLDGDGIAPLANSPLLARVAWLGLQYNQIDADGLDSLARSPFLDAVSLNLGGSHYGDAGVERLMSARWPKLRSLDISYNDISAAGAESLAKCRFLPALTTLDLSCNKVGGRAVGALLAAATGLEALNLGSITLGRDGLQALASSPLQQRLRKLDIGSNRVAGDLDALLDRPCLQNLAFLRLRDAWLRDEDGEVLARTPALTNLRSLDLSLNRIGPAGMTAFAAGPGLPSLTSLDFGHNHLGDEGVLALTRSPRLGQLRELDLNGNNLSPAVLAPLLQALDPNRLISLSLGYNALDDRLVGMLIEEPGFHRLQSLYLTDCNLGDAEKERLRQHFGAVVHL